MKELADNELVENNHLGIFCEVPHEWHDLIGRANRRIYSRGPDTSVVHEGLVQV